MAENEVDYRAIQEFWDGAPRTPAPAEVDLSVPVNTSETDSPQQDTAKVARDLAKTADSSLKWGWD